MDITLWIDEKIRDAFGHCFRDKVLFGGLIDLATTQTPSLNKT
jgi:hypothetical protein